MIDLKQYEVWFVTGSQHFMARKRWKKLPTTRGRSLLPWAVSKHIPVRVIFKPVLTTSESIRELCLEANSAKALHRVDHLDAHLFACQDVDRGLSLLKKPFAHLHTQYNREIPWAEIDMDFMNLNQAAHGDREFGFIGSRLRLERKVVVGHWQDDEVQQRLGVWVRAAAAWADWQGGEDRPLRG